MNGRSPSQSCTLEETLQQMNVLIQENRELKGEGLTAAFRASCWWVKGQPQR